MYRTLRLKDLSDIGLKFDICTLANKYVVTANTNRLEGDINAYLRIDSCENNTLGGTVLFSIRTGEQICLAELTAEEQLVIPEAYLSHIRESLSTELDILGQKKTIWSITLNKINNIHGNDNPNFERLPDDLQIPILKYDVVEKKEEPQEEEKPDSKSFFQKLHDIFKS